MNHLKIANWKRWQTYRSDRGHPPWIKLYRDLLRNYEWIKLSDSERGQLVTLWMLAADKDGKIPDDETWLEKLCTMSGKLNLQLFIDLGFIEKRRQGDVKTTDNVTTKKRNTDSPDTDTDTDTDEDKNKSDSETTFTEIPTKSKKKSEQIYSVTVQKVAELQEKFPSIDVKQKIEDLRDWCIENSDRRPTYRGMGLFLSRNIRKDVGKEARRKQIPKWKIESMQKALRMTHDTILGLTPSDPSYESEFNRILKNCCQDIGVTWAAELEKEARE